MYFSKLNLGFFALCRIFPTALAAPRNTMFITSRRDLFVFSSSGWSFSVFSFSESSVLSGSRFIGFPSSSVVSTSLSDAFLWWRYTSPECLRPFVSSLTFNSAAVTNREGTGLDKVFWTGGWGVFRSTCLVVLTRFQRLRARVGFLVFFRLSSGSSSSSSELLSGLSAQAFTTTARYLEKDQAKFKLKHEICATQNKFYNLITHFVLPTTIFSRSDSSVF